ncbi:hypothetical protein B9Z47_06375 [Limnohabitans sp. 2KL-1]|uniref:hypothetical protein n=1 Tax=Limnohabitans sp. 2KL-1 TaxID=1100699 RepID=UPI000D376513|nr:hypothetical protein [Limnohabitans sp. 2KL-1]PUE49124.1 hypothetical protein B9Z47_06375 [Limnohabitans sp. 2KL-1]
MSHEFVWKNGRRAQHAASAVLVAAMLAACGGEGDGLISANRGAEVLLKGREATVVQGTLESVKYRLTSMSWSVRPLAATNPVLSLTNQDCAIAVKNDMLTPTLATITSPAGSGGSTWQCHLVVYAQENVTVDAVYELVLSGVNEAGQTVSYQRTLRVQPLTGLTGLDPDAAYLQDLTIQPAASVCRPGSPIQMVAQGIDITDPGFYYRWRVVQGPGVVLAGANTPTMGFSTPIVTEPTITVIQLEASRSPLTSQTQALYMATAVVNSDPTYPYPFCSSRQEGN